MRLTLVRNATLLLEIEGRRVLVDPMLEMRADVRAAVPDALVPEDGETLDF